MEDGRRYRPPLNTFFPSSRQTFMRSRFPITKAKLWKKSRTSNAIRVARVTSVRPSSKRSTIGANRNIHQTSKRKNRNRRTGDIRSGHIPAELLGDDSVVPITPIFSIKTSEILVESTELGKSVANVNNESDSMISGMAPALLVGQCFSLMGISNVACQHGREPLFRWLSLRMSFSIIMSSFIMLIFIFSLSFHIQMKNLNKVVTYQTAIFFMNCFLASCFFIRLSRRWASLCAEFQNVEYQLSLYGNFSGLKWRIRTITAALFTSALVEHVIAQTNTFLNIRSQITNQSLREWLERFYVAQYSYVSFHIPFSPLVGIMTYYVNLTSTIIWNFNDLFIMLMSVAIASMFQRLNGVLVARAHKERDVESWRHLRETFNAICSLTRTVEDNLSFLVLLSFANNFFFICVQLLQTVRYETNIPLGSFYSAISFIFLVGKVASVSLFAASITEESRAIKRVLFSVSSKGYCVEVERFIHQLSFDDIALTGCKFFSISRPFLLTRSTIGAYGIILSSSKEEINRSTEGIHSVQTSTKRLGDNSAVPTAPVFLRTTSKIHVESFAPGHAHPAVNLRMDSMISGMAPALLVGQCFSLMAVSNVAFQYGREPYFRWLSFRMLFSIIISSLLVLIAILEISFYIHMNKMTVVAYQTGVFYLNCFLASCLFIRLGRRWASLCTEFQNLENQISFYGNSSGLKRRMRTITAAVLILALVEHTISQANTIIFIESSTFNNSQQEWLERYYVTQFEQISFHLPFSPLIVIVAVFVNITATFIWNYNDLFIMLMSVAIASKFQLLNNNLMATAHKKKDVKTWRYLRGTFNALTSLTQTVEDSLSAHVLLSVANNLFFICVQLLHTVSYNTSFGSFYSAVSLSSLIVRAVCVSLFAASIPERSRAFKRVLFSVTSKEYCDEVERLIQQVSFDDITLTGCNFFSLTRSFLLGVFGTVATYEIVLVQFNSISSI